MLSCSIFIARLLRGCIALRRWKRCVVGRQKVALRMKDKPVIIRTLDVGGDKEIPYLNMKAEENPFMGKATFW